MAKSRNAPISATRRAAILRRGRNENAQSVIEFALMSMILLLILAGVVDFSRFMYYQTAVDNATRDGLVLVMEPCPDRDVCTHYKATSDDFALQAARCSGQPYLNLQPVVSCTQCITSTCTTGSPCTDTSAGTGCLATHPDVCVQRGATVTAAHASSCSSLYPSTITSASIGQAVVVNIGYDFEPVTPLLKPFFPQKTCFPSDTTVHTLCGTLAGRVFS